MKILGDILFCIGFVGFILSASAYETNPVVCVIVGLTGLALLWTGYRIDSQVWNNEK